MNTPKFETDRTIRNDIRANLVQSVLKPSEPPQERAESGFLGTFTPETVIDSHIPDITLTESTPLTDALDCLRYDTRRMFAHARELERENRELRDRMLSFNAKMESYGISIRIETK